MARSQVVIRNVQTSLTEKVLYYIVGSVLVLYLAILCGASWLPGNSFSEWLNNFTQFIIIERHFIVGFTSATPTFIGMFELIWTVAYMYNITKIQHPYRGREHGDAKWGEAKAFTNDYANHNKLNEVVVKFGDVEPPKKKVIVNTHNYWLAEGVYLNIDNKLTSNLNILVVGPPGTGKSFRLSRPILSMLAGNYLVTDPKGELSEQSGQFFEDNGYEVLILNIESEEAMSNSIHFNPFRYLRCESDILSLAQILFKATKDPEAENSGDAFFEQSAETLLTCIFYLMHYTYPPDMQDWEHFVELLESTTVKADPKTGGIDNSDPNGILSRFERANSEWKKGTFTNGVPQKNNLKGYKDIEKFYNGAQETTSSIVASLDAHCRYMKLDCVKELLSEDEIDITNSFGYSKKTRRSKTGKRILFIVTSEDKRYFDWITSMVYSLFFDVLYHLTAVDKSLHNTLPFHLTFLMDEFANVTLPDSFVERLSTMRSRGMSAIVIIQNLIQLKRKFPKFDMDKDLIANMCTTIILGGPDPDSCEFLSKLFGTMTIHKQTTGLTRGMQASSSENEDVMEKPLFSPEDMYGMNKDGPCAIAVKGAYPLWVTKCRFELSPMYPLLTREEAYRVNRKKKLKTAKYDYSKSPCEQIPKLYMGNKAKKILQHCKADKIPVIKITEADIEAYTVLERYKKEQAGMLGNDVSTEAFWELLHKNKEFVLEENRRNSLDIEMYDDTAFITVQKLRNAGFEANKINVLNPLIVTGMKYEEIITFFRPDMEIEEIQLFATRLAKIKQKVS